MKTWVNSDDICEDTRNIIKSLSTPEFGEFGDVRESIISLKECIDEEEYDFYVFSDAAFTLLKTLLKIRIKLRKADPGHHSIPALTLAVDDIRKQLKLNERYVHELIQVDSLSSRARVFFWFACSAAAMLLLFAIFYI